MRGMDSWLSCSRRFLFGREPAGQACLLRVIFPAFSMDNGTCMGLFQLASGFLAEAALGWGILAAIADELFSFLERLEVILSHGIVAGGSFVRNEGGVGLGRSLEVFFGILDGVDQFWKYILATIAADEHLAVLKNLQHLLNERRGRIEQLGSEEPVDAFTTVPDVLPVWADAGLTQSCTDAIVRHGGQGRVNDAGVAAKGADTEGSLGIELLPVFADGEVDGWYFLHAFDSAGRIVSKGF